MRKREGGKKRGKESERMRGKRSNNCRFGFQQLHLSFSGTLDSLCCFFSSSFSLFAVFCPHRPGPPRIKRLSFLIFVILYLSEGHHGKEPQGYFHLRTTRKTFNAQILNRRPVYTERCKTSELRNLSFESSCSIMHQLVLSRGASHPRLTRK